MDTKRRQKISIGEKTEQDDGIVTSVAESAERLRLFFPNEKAFVQAIKDAAEDLGYLTYHTWDSRHSAAGFPDLVLTKHGCLAFIECKMPGNKPSPAQKKWLDWLELIPSHNVHVLTLYPAGYDAFIDWLARDVLGEMLAPVRYKSVISSRTVETVKGGSPTKAMFPGQMTGAANAKTFIIADAQGGE